MLSCASLPAPSASQCRSFASPTSSHNSSSSDETSLPSTSRRPSTQASDAIEPSPIRWLRLCLNFPRTALRFAGEEFARRGRNLRDERLEVGALVGHRLRRGRQSAPINRRPTTWSAPRLTELIATRRSPAKWKTEKLPLSGLAADDAPCRVERQADIGSLTSPSVRQNHGTARKGSRLPRRSPPPFVRDVVIAGVDRDDVAALDLSRHRRLPVRLHRSCARCAGPAGARASAVRAAVRERLATLAAEFPGSSTDVARALLLADPPSIDTHEMTDKVDQPARRAVQPRRTPGDGLRRTLLGACDLVARDTRAA